MIYTYGLSLGAKLVARGRFNRGLRLLIAPVNYWRTLEYRLVLDAAQFTPGDRILDIGSPKLLSLYLAKTLDTEVHATDIEDYFINDYTYMRAMEGLPPEKYSVAVADGRKLPFDNESFTKVFSVSVLEHIPDDGDSQCIAEIERVLAPGGRCILTVPFSPTSKVEYIRGDDLYWAGSSSTSEHGTFYQRRYSEEDLRQRLIKPSSMSVRTIQYVGERVLTNSPHEFSEYLPLYLGPIHPLASRFVHTRPTENWRSLKKPLCALVVLEKKRTGPSES